MAKKTSLKTIQLSKEDAESFTAGLGQVTGGSYRLILLADKQGVPKALGYESVREWVNERLGGYVRHPIEERRRIVDEMTENGANQSQIAKSLGVNDSTVIKDKIALGKHPRIGLGKYQRKNIEKQKLPAHAVGTILEKQNSKDESLPKDWGKPKPADPDQLAEKGLELLVWEKVKDRFLPFWNELLESLEPDEAEILSTVIWHYAPTEPAI